MRYERGLRPRSENVPSGLDVGFDKKNKREYWLEIGGLTAMLTSMAVGSAILATAVNQKRSPIEVTKDIIGVSSQRGKELSNEDSEKSYIRVNGLKITKDKISRG